MFREAASGIVYLLLMISLTYMINAFTLMKKSTVKFVKAFPAKSLKTYVTLLDKNINIKFHYFVFLDH